MFFWLSFCYPVSGDAQLAKNVKNKVFSFDLVANDPSVIACDMSKVCACIRNIIKNYHMHCLSYLSITILKRKKICFWMNYIDNFYVSLITLCTYLSSFDNTCYISLITNLSILHSIGLFWGVFHLKTVEGILLMIL